MKILIPDKVSKTTTKILEKKEFKVEQKPGITIKETNELAKESEAIIVRSYNLHELEFDKKLLAIARAGAGVNNIPIDKCTDNGVGVFNTPGANANAVKELVLSGLLLSSRKIVQGINWTANLTTEDIEKTVEKNKGQFAGTEIKGKTLGVIGLGAIGIIVANDASGLGMEVIGHDPYITIENAWRLSRNVRKAKDINQLLEESDYITLHVPLLPDTKHILNKNIFSKMKKGVKIMNFSRGELVNTEDLIDAIEKGIVETYVTDFPQKELLGNPKVILIPHLGASTEEAEENCAVMAAEQIADFLKNGNTVNSVNLPECRMERKGNQRITVINKNIPKMIEQITNTISKENLNICEMINKSKNQIAYNIIDLDSITNDNVIEKIKAIDGVIKVRRI